MTTSLQTRGQRERLGAVLPVDYQHRKPPLCGLVWCVDDPHPVNRDHLFL